jgi:hypothetical protein
VYSLDDTIALGVANRGRLGFDAIAAEKFLKLTACKLRAIVMDDTLWAGVAAQPITIKEYANVVAALILCCDEFWPACGLVNNCKL